MRDKNSGFSLQELYTFRIFSRKGLENISKGLATAPSIRGFTLIEILLVSVLATFLLGMGLFSSLSFYQSYVFRTEKEILISVLSRARGLAQNNINESTHGVHFDPDHYIIFRGETYDEKDPMNEMVAKNPSIDILNTEDILFSQLSGSVDIVSEKKITITDGIKSSDIFVNHEGRINY